MNTQRKLSTVGLIAIVCTVTLALTACSHSVPNSVGQAIPSGSIPVAQHGVISASTVNSQISKINADPNISPGAKQMMINEMQYALKHAH